MKGEFLSLEEARLKHKRRRAIKELEIALKYQNILDKDEIVDRIEKVLKILGS